MKNWIPSLFLSVFVLFATFPAYALPDTLKKVVIDIANKAAYNHTPVVITDLDETVIDSTVRRYYSYQKAAEEICGTIREKDCSLTFGLNLEEFFNVPNRYDSNPLFDRVGITSSGTFRKELDTRMLSHYLSGEFMHLDQPVPGAAEYVQNLKVSGANVFYVSSRYEDAQGKGTRENMKTLGMLNDAERDRVILRPRGMSSIDFKKQSFETIRNWTAKRHGHVMLVMENEPENINAMTDLFPEALGVFVEGAYLKDEPLKSKALVSIRNFR